MINLVLFSIFLNLLTCFSLSIFLIIIKNKYRFHTFFLINLVFWGLFYYFWLTAEYSEMALLHARISLVFVVFIPYFFLNFCFEYANHTLSKLGRYLHTGFVLLLAGLMFTPLMIEDVHPFLEFRFALSLGSLFWVLLIYYGIAITIGHTLLYKVVKNNRKALFILSGFAIGFAGGTTNFFFYFNIPIYPMGNFLISIHAPLVTYAIIRHHLFDINIIVSRGIARLITIMMFVVVYAVVFGLFQVFIPNANIVLIAILNLILLVVACETYPLIKSKIQTVPDKVFLKDRYDYKDAIRYLFSKLERSTQLRDIVLALESLFDTIVKLPGLKIFLPKDIETSPQISEQWVCWDVAGGRQVDNTLLLPNLALLEAARKEKRIIVHTETSDTLAKELARMEAGVCIPCVVHDQCLGLIFVGKRPGEGYTYDDLMLFELMQSQLGMALDRLRAYAKVLQGHESLQKVAGQLRMVNFYAHEIKAPLAALYHYTKRSDGISEDFKQYFIQQTGRVEALVKKMNDLANDRRSRKETLINLNDVIEKTVAFYRLSMNMETYYEDDLPLIKGDFEDLQIIFMNLMKNAEEAMDDQRERRHLYFRTRYDVNRNRVQVEVEDTGSGIAKDQLDKIFDGDYSTKKRGSGIGLAAVQTITHEHQGRVQVESKLGKGTTFILRFPVAEGAVTSECEELESIHDSLS